jgi:hypothetical protein
MALSWLAVLKNVPWADVVSNAPVVTEGAKKLWNAVAKKASSQSPADAGTQETPPSGAAVLEALEARLAATEAALVELRGQLLSSSELISSLAEQNNQLIARIEQNRVRVRWLAIATGLLALVAFSALVLVLMR